MPLIGLSCGQPNGSVEILVKAALLGAEEHGVEVSLIRLDELHAPQVASGDATGRDDAPWFWEQLMGSDGIIVGAPIYSRTIPGTLRALGDRLLGPNADVAFVDELLKLKRAGKDPAVPFRIDERVFKHRVGGFIACGGSLPDRWKTLALPLMHTLTFSLQIGVVDQVQFAGAGLPASIVLDQPALDRASLLGRNVAGQIGRPFDEVEYQGQPGLCPMCHLDVIVLRESQIECATCGAGGQLVIDGGSYSVRFTGEGRDQSVISLAEKRAHFLEVQQTAAHLAKRVDEINAQAARFAAYDCLLRPPHDTTPGESRDAAPHREATPESRRRGVQA